MDLCDLMVRSTVYQSFSVVALVVVLVIGLSVILLSLRVEDVAVWMGQWLGGCSCSSSRGGDRGHEVRIDEWKDHVMLGEQAWRAKVGVRAEEEEKEDGVSRVSVSLRSSDVKDEATVSTQHGGQGPPCSSQRIPAQACGSWI